MKVLILSMHYLDQQLGGPNCSKAFIKAIASIYEDCTLIFPEHNGIVNKPSFLENTNIKLIPCYDYRSSIKKGIDVYRGILHRFSKAADKCLKENKFDIVFINSSFMASSGVLQSALRHCDKVVTIHHNVEKNYIKDNEQNFLFRYPYEHYVVKAERDSISQSLLNIFLTKEDCDYFKKEMPAKSDSFEVIGMFEYEEHIKKEISVEYGKKFVISGSLNAKQTETALLDFFHNYFPVLNKKYPNSELILTGRNPSERLLSLCSKYPNISVVKNPKDIMNVIVRGNYYIAPIYTGSGLKLRIMDGLRLGLPVIAHEVSCRGYEPIVNEGFMFSYHDVASFESSLEKLVQISEHKKVAECFNAHFSFNAGKSRLIEILNKHKLLPTTH